VNKPQSLKEHPLNPTIQITISQAQVKQTTLQRTQAILAELTHLQERLKRIKPGSPGSSPSTSPKRLSWDFSDDDQKNKFFSISKKEEKWRAP